MASDSYQLRVTIEVGDKIIKAPNITWPEPVVTRTFDAQGVPSVTAVQPDAIEPEWPVYTHDELAKLGVDDESIDHFVEYGTLVPVK